MEINTILCGDNIQSLKTLPDECVDMCVTSPPYYALRDYGCEGQIGLEGTPEKYVERLVEVFREVKRVLKEDGTLWVNIGDSYNGNKKGNTETHRNKNVVTDSFTKQLWQGAKRKDLIGIPWMLAFALRADGWYLRQDIIWHKPNAMPESVKDRCTKTHEYLFLLSKSPKYYFDYESIQEEATGYDGRKDTMMYGSKKYQTSVMPNGNPNSLSKNGHERWQFKEVRKRITENTKYKDENTMYGCHVDYLPYRNKRDVWFVNTKPCNEAHFAVFPQKLVEPCIKAGCREGGIVLDPFMGSGTTAIVARKLERNYIGCELNPKYVEIANKRLSDELGLFL